MWSPFLQKNIAKVEQIQRHFTKIAFRKCGIPFTSYTDRLEKIGLSTLENRRIYYDIVLLYKIVYGLSDLKFENFFKFHQTPYSLRSHSLQVEPLFYFKSAQWLNSFFVRAPKVWNALPSDIVCVKSLPVFKCRVKSYKFIP